MNLKFGIVLVIVLYIIFAVSITIYQPSQLESSNKEILANISLELERAKNFQVSYIGEKKIMVDGANRTLTLVPVSDVQSKEEIGVPVSRMVIFSSTHAALIDRLGISDKVVGVGWGRNYEWYIDSIRDGLEKGRIKDVGPSNSPSYDQIVALEPDLVVLVGGAGLWEQHAKKLDEVGINYVVNSEWLEDDPLGRFEWIKFFSLFTNDEDRASAIYTETKNKIVRISDKVSNLDRPDVLWASVFSGTVYVPRAESYVGTIINMANGNYVFSDIHGTGGAQISLEELVSRGNDADILVYSNTVNKTSDIIAASPLLAELDPIRRCNVYAFQPWYWQTLDRVDEYVNDVAAILHPGAFEGYELKQFKKVACE